MNNYRPNVQAILVVLLLILVGCTKEVEKVSLVERNGLMFELNSNNGFTGLAVSSHESSQRTYECKYTSGKKDGFLRRWYKNGQLSAEYSYSNGELDGTYLEWDESGNPELISTYVDGRLKGEYLSWWKLPFSSLVGHKKVIANYNGYGNRDGKYISYYSHGHIQEQSHYSNGILDGEYSYWTYLSGSGDAFTGWKGKYLLEAGVYSKGKKTGNWEYKNAKGELITFDTYNPIKKKNTFNPFDYR